MHASSPEADGSKHSRGGQTGKASSRCTQKTQSLAGGAQGVRERFKDVEGLVLLVIPFYG